MLPYVYGANPTKFLTIINNINENKNKDKGLISCRESVWTSDTVVTNELNWFEYQAFPNISTKVIGVAHNKSDSLIWLQSRAENKSVIIILKLGEQS